MVPCRRERRGLCLVLAAWSGGIPVASSSLSTKVGGSINARGGALTVANGGTGLILGPSRLEVGLFGQVHGGESVATLGSCGLLAPWWCWWPVR
jgi:hypothetical protein